MATRNQSEDSDEEFQGIQFERLHQEYRQARGDQREVTIEKKDQMRLQKFSSSKRKFRDETQFFCFLS